VYLPELLNKYLNIFLRKRIPKLVTGIKILHVQGGWVTLLLAVVPSDTRGGGDKGSSLPELDTLSIGIKLSTFGELAASTLSVVQEP
jgi:hypothetical protein